jgi:AraC-like DNA-binding protein
MRELLLTGGELEACRPDKPRVRMLYPINAVHYVLSGHGFFNGRRLSAGQGFICRRNRPVDYGPDPRDPWTYFWATVDGGRVDELLAACGLDGEPYCFSFDWGEDLRRMAGVLFPDGRFAPRNELFAEGCAKWLLSYHAGAGAARQPASQRRLHVEAAKEWMRRNYYRRVTIAQVAEALHLSRGYLRNIFYECEGCPPQQFLIETRLRRAKELLETGDIPVSMLAASAGYADVTQFYRIFRKYTGLSPCDYRRRVKGAERP